MREITPVPAPGPDFWTQLEVHVHEWQVQQSRSLGQRTRRQCESLSATAAEQAALMQSPQAQLPW